MVMNEISVITGRRLVACSKHAERYLAPIIYLSQRTVRRAYSFVWHWNKAKEVSNQTDPNKRYLGNFIHYTSVFSLFYNKKKRWLQDHLEHSIHRNAESNAILTILFIHMLFRSYYVIFKGNRKNTYINNYFRNIDIITS